MRTFQIIILSAVLLGIISCDDTLVNMDTFPPLPGHLWRVYNGHNPAVLESYSFREFDDGWSFYNTPFDSGDAYGVACGDGRVWVDGRIDNYYEQGHFIWEPDVGKFPAIGGGGLAYDGEYLWSISSGRFFRINPNTEEYEQMFVIDYNPDGYDSFSGLTFADGYLWATASLNDEIFKIDRATGTIQDTITIPKDDPGLQEPRGLAWDGEAFWVNDYKSQRFYRLDPKDGHILGYVENAGDQPLPWGLAFGQGPPADPPKQ